MRSLLPFLVTFTTLTGVPNLCASRLSTPLFSKHINFASFNLSFRECSSIYLPVTRLHHLLNGASSRSNTFVRLLVFRFAIVCLSLLAALVARETGKKTLSLMTAQHGPCLI